MIIKDFNQMTLSEIMSVFEKLGTTFLIEDGKIVNAN